MRRQGVPVDVVRAVDRSEWDGGCRFDFPNPDYR
jgi:hypothetical protein